MRLKKVFRTFILATLIIAVALAFYVHDKAFIRIELKNNDEVVTVDDTTSIQRIVAKWGYDFHPRVTLFWSEGVSAAQLSNTIGRLQGASSLYITASEKRPQQAAIFPIADLVVRKSSGGRETPSCSEFVLFLEGTNREAEKERFAINPELPLFETFRPPFEYDVRPGRRRPWSVQRLQAEGWRFPSDRQSRDDIELTFFDEAVTSHALNADSIVAIGKRNGDYDWKSIAELVQRIPKQVLEELEEYGNHPHAIHFRFGPGTKADDLFKAISLLRAVTYEDGGATKPWFYSPDLVNSPVTDIHRDQILFSSGWDEYSFPNDSFGFLNWSKSLEEQMEKGMDLQKKHYIEFKRNLTIRIDENLSAEFCLRVFNACAGFYPEITIRNTITYVFNDRPFKQSGGSESIENTISISGSGFTLSPGRRVALKDSRVIERNMYPEREIKVSSLQELENQLNIISIQLMQSSYENDSRKIILNIDNSVTSRVMLDVFALASRTGMQTMRSPYDSTEIIKRLPFIAITGPAFPMFTFYTPWYGIEKAIAGKGWEISRVK